MLERLCLGSLSGRIERLATGVALTLVGVGLAGCAAAPMGAADDGAHDEAKGVATDALVAPARGEAAPRASEGLGNGDAPTLTPWASADAKRSALSLIGPIIRPFPTPLQRIRQRAAQYVHKLPADASPSSREVPYYHGLNYGLGIDSPSGTAMNLVATGTPSTVPGGGGQTMSFTWTEISSQEDLMSHLGISADASGSIGLFSASARFSFAKDVQVNSSSVFAVLDLQVMNAFSQIDAPSVAPNAAALINQGNMTAFQQQFGDRFVRGLLTGGAFFGTVEIVSNSETDKQDIESSVSGAFSVVSGKVSLSDSFSKAIQNHSVHVQVYTEGGTLPAQLPTDPVSLMNAANAWLPTVADKGVVYSALVDSDSILPLPNPPTYIDLQQQEDVLTQCSLDRNADMQTLNDIAYIKRNPGQFLNPQGGALGTADLKALDTLAAQIQQDMTTIQRAADNALNNPKTAAYPVLQVQPPAVIPVQRLQNYITTVPNLYGMYPPDVDPLMKSAGLSGAWSYSVESCPNFDGDVIRQSPAAGTHVPYGSTVSIVVCRDIND